MPNSIEIALVSQLIEASRDALANAYCPYSNFPVGAALLCQDGTIISGCNIETATYSGICAERSAFASAISQGKRAFKAIAIISNNEDDYVTPCGVCRQFMIEFEPSLLVFQCKKDMDYAASYLNELLPRWFGPKMLDCNTRS